jgi:hypothetical protein
VALARLRVGDKRAAGDRVGEQGYGTRIDTVAAQAVDVQPAEIVVAYAADDPGGTSEAAHLVDEDGGSAARERPHQGAGRTEALASLSRHDLYQDLPDGHDPGHSTAPFRGDPLIATSIATAHRITYFQVELFEAEDRTVTPPAKPAHAAVVRRAQAACCIVATRTLRAAPTPITDDIEPRTAALFMIARPQGNSRSLHSGRDDNSVWVSRIELAEIPLPRSTRIDQNGDLEHEA